MLHNNRMYKNGNSELKVSPSLMFINQKKKILKGNEKWAEECKSINHLHQK